MRSKLLLLAGCIALLSGCASIHETGITRAEAIRIAKQACPEYPQQFEFVDRAEWIPEKGYWMVTLADQSSYHGRIYRINPSSEIIGTTDFNGTPPPPAYYAAPPPYYPGPPVVVGVYGGPRYYHHW